MKEPIDPVLYRVLACPKCKGDVSYNTRKTGLVCKRCHKMYEIRDGIPIMLIS